RAAADQTVRDPRRAHGRPDRLEGDGEPGAAPDRLREVGRVPRAPPAGAVRLEDVQAVRERIARAQQLAAIRFREAFAAGALPPVAHLRIQAAALIECAEGVKLNGTIAYDVSGDVVTPYVERGRPVYPFFEVARTPVAILEYWLIISEIEAST